MGLPISLRYVRNEERILRKVLRMDIYEGKVREDNRKQDGKTRANKT